jgi:hypothetical protein
MFRQSFALLVLMLVAVPALAWGLEDPVTVTAQRAAELGMIVRSKASGPEAVGVELEFPTTGALQKYQRVELALRDGKKTLLFTTLKEEQTPAGHMIVRFVLDRSKVPQCQLKVVTQDGLSRVGYTLPLKDFIDLENVR